MDIVKKIIPVIGLLVLSALLLSSCDLLVEPDQTGNVPKVETVAISDITTSSAVSGGKGIDDYGFAIEEKGVCWCTEGEPTTDDDKTSNGTDAENFSSELTGLTANTTYYVRAYVTNEFGTGYGKTVTFKTEEAKVVYGPTVKDVDGNEYRTVVIGTQTWMLENLKTTKYNDGTAIAKVLQDADWTKNASGGFCWYNNDEASGKAAFGAIYNWYAVNSGKLAPKGWHVPHNQEWETLKKYLGGIYLAGGKLKEAGTSHWKAPNLATNESGFTAVPAGTRNYFGTFSNQNTTANFWSATVPADNNATVWLLTNEHTGLTNFVMHKASGYSVRCIKD